MKYVWEHLEEFFIIPLMFAMSIIIFIQVIMRYVFQNSLTWSEELARYMFVWLVYFAVSFTARREKNPPLYRDSERDYRSGFLYIYRDYRRYGIPENHLERTDFSRYRASDAVCLCCAAGRLCADGNPADRMYY